MCEEPKATALLEWYDHNARIMPWRVGPAERAAGIRPNPYRIWLSEVMLQQTTVVTVKNYFQRFTQRWPDVQSLASATDADVMGEWAGLGYYARARNLLKCARVVANDLDGHFPTTEDALRELPGIGPYTAAALAAIAYDLPATVVDGNVERVMARIHDIHTPLPAAKPELTARAQALTPDKRPGDYAQAVMDLGATICTPRNPACGLCPWRSACKSRLAGTSAGLPRKTPKKKKPTRYGVAYVARRVDGAILLERRPDHGLLGGMLGWPGTDWSKNPDSADHTPPIRAEWQDHPAEALHTFTHFHLRLKIRTALVPMERTPRQGIFFDRNDFAPSTLPTVMRKVFDLIKEDD